MAEPSSGGKLGSRIIVLTLIRLIINVTHRMAYPFLPAIARGLGVSVTSAGLLITARSTVGLASPLFGPLSDRVGRRQMMVTGLLALACGGVVIACVPRYPAALAGFLLLGLAKVIFDPSLLAYLGDRVPYRRRGLAIAATELSWAGGLLIGAPVVGLIIGRWGWRVPFGVSAALAAVGLAALLLVLPSDRSDRRRVTDPSIASSFVVAWRTILGNQRAAAALAVLFLVGGANEVLFIVYGTWMETGFGLSVGRLGLATIVIGVAELLGEIGAGGLSDRLGKRRSVSIGLVLTATGYALLPLVSASLRSALAGLFLIFLCFEFAIVSNIPLVTELMPRERGTMMAMSIAAFSLGRAVAAPVGTALWATGGLAWTGLVAAAVTLVAFGLLRAFVPEGEGER